MKNPKENNGCPVCGTRRGHYGGDCLMSFKTHIRNEAKMELFRFYILNEKIKTPHVDYYKNNRLKVSKYTEIIRDGIRAGFTDDQVNFLEKYL